MLFIISIIDISYQILQYFNHSTHTKIIFPASLWRQRVLHVPQHLTDPRDNHATSWRPVPKQCSGKSHVDDPDWSVLLNFSQKKNRSSCTEAQVSSRGRLQTRDDMSSPPKEKAEIKGGHPPAGNARSCCVVFESSLWSWRPFVSVVFQTRNHTTTINTRAVT